MHFLQLIPLISLTTAASLHRRQTANDLLTNLNALATTIPLDCVTQCAAFQTDVGTCPQAAATIAACFCTTAFLADTTTCTTCMTTSYTTSGDTANAAVPAQELAAINAACAAVAGTTPLTSSSALGVVTSSTSLTSSTTAPGRTVATTSSTSSTSSSSSSSSSKSVQTGPVTVQSTVAGTPFPSQTKSASVFSGAGRMDLNGVAVGLLAGLVGMVLFA